MILLDTNLMSEPLRQAPEPRVIEWIDAQAMETLFLSSITVAELRAGVALLPAGKRRAGLQENLEKRVLPLFAGRVLPFDLACTQAYAALMAKARGAGPPYGRPPLESATARNRSGMAARSRSARMRRAARTRRASPFWRNTAGRSARNPCRRTSRAVHPLPNL